MKKIHIILLLLSFFVLTIVAICFVLPSYVNWDKHRGFVETFLSNYTGYDTEIKGKLEIQVVPNPKLYAENIQIKGFSGEGSLAEIEHIIIYKDLKELLSLNFSVNELVINRPTINMHIAEDGNPNWEPLKIRNNNYYSRKIKSFVGKLPLFKKVSIENASIIYRDNTKSLTHDISNLYVNANTIDSQLVIDSKFMVNGSKYKMLNKFDLTNLVNIRVENEMTADIAKVSSQGVIRNYNSLSNFSFTGKTNIIVNDIEKIELEDNSVLGYVRKHVDLSNLNIQSDLTYSKNKLTIPNFEVKTETNHLTGNVEWETKEGVDISASLDIKKLNVSEIKEVESSDLKDWMETTLDFSFLNNLSVATVVTCSECSYGDKKLTESNFRASLTNNNLIINQLAVKSGNEGSFNLTAIASLNNPVGFEIKQEFKKFPIHKFSPKLVEDRIKVDLDGKFNLSSNGNSLKEILGNLVGTFGLDLKNTELQKVNTKNLKEMTESFLMGKNKVSYNTKVEDMKIEGVIRDGVIRHSDLEFVINEKFYKSKGKLDLANLTFNYRLVPELIKKDNLGVIVKGKISKPEIISDKLTPKGVIDAYGRIVSRDLVTQSYKKKVKTHFDYQDKSNLKENVEKYLFNDKG